MAQVHEPLIRLSLGKCLKMMQHELINVRHTTQDVQMKFFNYNKTKVRLQAITSTRSIQMSDMVMCRPLMDIATN